MTAHRRALRTGGEPHLKAGWTGIKLRQVIDNTLQALEPVNAPATWVLSSHDETRHVTRFGRPGTAAAAVMGFDSGGGTDIALGTAVPGLQRC